MTLAVYHLVRHETCAPDSAAGGVAPGPAMSEVSFGRRLTMLAGQDGDATALVFAPAGGGEQSLTWSDVERRSNQVAHHLHARGVTQDDLVVVAVPNCPEHVFATFGAWKLGASVLCLRHDLPSWERDRMLELATPRAAVADWDGTECSTVSCDELAATVDLPAEPPPDRVPGCARLIATSGSTGRPKIITTPAPGLYSDMPSAIAPSALRGGPEAAIHLVTSPLYHTNGFAACYLSLLAGERTVLMERFDAALAVDLVERHRATHTIMVPTMLQRVARLPDIGQRDMSSLVRVLYGGAVVPEWVVRTWIDLVGPDHFWLSYGSSEGIGLCVATGREWLDHQGTSGRPVTCELRILGPDGTRLPPNEVGEIYMRPLDVTHEPFRYVGSAMPEPTPDGFWSIGDVGYVDDDGYLYVVDRRQDMIITGGANVFPAEVEAALSEHEGIVDSVVVGLTDPEWGRRVHAIVQPVDPACAPTEAELRNHCRARLAAYKVPKTFEVIDALPRTPAGKINRTALAEARDAHTASTEAPA